MLAVVTCWTLGCASGNSGQGSVTSATASNDLWPLCGVLSDAGYANEGELTFLVPAGLRGPEVARYNVIDATGGAMPMAVYASWWLCITRGKIRRAPAEEQGEPIYGLIEAQEIVIHQSTGERGQE